MEKSSLEISPSADVRDTIIKTGYLMKYKTMKKKFFVLRCSPTGISTLEYYDNEKKFMNRSASKRAIQLNCCFNINKKSDTKHKFLIALYTRSDCFCIVLENEKMQEEWLQALILLQPNRESSESGPAFEHIWQVRLNPKGIGSSQNRSGNYQLCLTSKTVNLVKMLSEGEGDLEFPLSTIRRCGHSDCFFFMEVGRQAPTGSGELWMQVDDTVIAQNIHEATLNNAMQSINQIEEMRPRSHSNNSNDNKPHRRTAAGSSWRLRCDSMPAHTSQSYVNSDREDSTSRDEHVPNSPASPSRSRQKFPSIRSNQSGYRSQNMFSKSLSQPNSNSSPIPNSPLSESPQSFIEGIERYVSNPSHSPDGSIDDYGSSPMDTHHRFGRTPESPTPTPIREESIESDEYINMSPSASSKAMPVPRSSVGLGRGHFHLHEPPAVRRKQTPIDDINPYSPMNSSCDASLSEEKEVYMNMEPSINKSRISLDVPTNQKVPNKDKLQTSSSQAEDYIMMAPKGDNKSVRKVSKHKRQSSREEPVSRSSSRLSQKSNCTESPESYMFMSPSSAEGVTKDAKAHGKEIKSQVKDKRSSKEVKASGKGVRSNNLKINGTSHSHSKNNGLSMPKTANSEPQEAYVNFDFNSPSDRNGAHSKKRTSPNMPQKSTLAVCPQSPGENENEVYTMMAPTPHNDTLDRNCGEEAKDTRSKDDLVKVKSLDKNENVQVEYMNINFGVKIQEGKKSPREGKKSSKPKLDSSSEYMNIDYRRVKASKMPVVSFSPIAEKNTIDLTDSIKNMSFPVGGMRNLGDTSPGLGSISDADTSSRHSSRRSSQTSLQEERELNYVDVDISPNESSQSIECQRSNSPFPRRSDGDKPDQSITYASIDFTKSEGLRSLRESRF